MQWNKKQISELHRETFYLGEKQTDNGKLTCLRKSWKIAVTGNNEGKTLNIKDVM